MWWLWVLGVLGAIVVLIVIYDLVQRKHAVLCNFPIIGHFRYWLEMIGPELRQYIVTSNDEEKPFSRDRRRWVYASSKKENNYFGFGTDADQERSSNYLIIKHSEFPVLGGHANGRPTIRTIRFPAPRCWAPVRASQVVPPRVGREYLRHELRLAERAGGRSPQPGMPFCGCLQNTGEGGVSPHHLTAAN